MTCAGLPPGAVTVSDVTHRFPALIAAPAPAQGRLWLTGARLFDGTGAPLRENTAILVEDGVIRRVADDREACPDGARPVDVGQRVLMPGLIDAHTHASGRVRRPRRAPRSRCRGSRPTSCRPNSVTTCASA